MNKNETKYTNTARLMNEALLFLLEKKNYAYITVKEICEKAGVNRSTFYLHYETMEDLLAESIEYVIQKRDSKYTGQTLSQEYIANAPLNDLVLIHSSYLIPYLEFVKENKHIFIAALSQPGTFRVTTTFDSLFNDYINRIMARFQIPEADRRYMLIYYLSGINALIMAWVENGCKEHVDHIANLLTDCIRPYLDGKTHE